MKIEITRDSETAKWKFIYNGETITEQKTLSKLLHKAHKYMKSQGL